MCLLLRKLLKKKFKIINSKFLLLKKIRKKEIEILRKQRNLFDVRNNMLNQRNISKKFQIQWYKRIKKIKNARFFSIYYKNILVGSGSLLDINKKNKNCTWGFYIFKKYFGCFGILAQYKIIEYAFNNFKLYKIYGKTLSTNYKILKIHKKFGFKIEGKLKDQIFIKNKKIDIILTSLFKTDWIKNKKKIKLLIE